MLGRDTDAFISMLGHLTTLIRGERSEAEFLRQSMTLATVGGNAQSVTQAGDQAHELGSPCIICELHFVKFTLCIFHLKEIGLLFSCHNIIVVNVICIVIIMVENKT